MTDLAQILEHGRKLAVEDWIDRHPLGEQFDAESICRSSLTQVDPDLVVWTLLCEAADTLRRLPDREQAWLKHSQRAAWPETAKLQADEFAAAREQIAAGEKLEARTRLGPPPAAAIDRMFVVMDWLGYIQRRHRRRDIKVLFALAEGRPMAEIRQATGLTRQGVHWAKRQALKDIAKGVMG